MIALMLGIMLAGAAIVVALMATRTKELEQKLDGVDERIRDAEKRASDANSARLAVQAHFQGVADAEAERDRLNVELNGLHRELRLLDEQRRAAEADLAEVQHRVAGLRAELAPLMEQARLPIPSPNGLADRPPARG